MEVKDWAKNIDWNRRIKAVCKPCWEIKYCPYGSLVEYMPLEDDNKEKICRIFGHICPVFKVAEPFTETKELRNISRIIPREVQLKVSRRDNNVCQLCSKSILDRDVHFDHIIPWSKGGSSDENNIRILCPECNLKRGNDFESELLVLDFNELANGLIDLTQEMLYDIIVSIFIINNIRKENDNNLTIKNIFSKLQLTKQQEETAEIVYKLAFELDNFISLYLNNNFNKTEIEKIKYRFGYNKQIKVQTLQDTAKKFNVSVTNIQKTERKLFNFIGLNIEYVKDENKLIAYDNKMIQEINKIKL